MCITCNQNQGLIPWCWNKCMIQNTKLQSRKMFCKIHCIQYLPPTSVLGGNLFFFFLNTQFFLRKYKCHSIVRFGVAMLIILNVTSAHPKTIFLLSPFFFWNNVSWALINIHLGEWLLSIKFVIMNSALPFILTEF